MRLSELLQSELFSQTSEVPQDAGQLRVTGLSADSRRVERGDLFVAIPGTRADGSRFMADAAARGAVAVVAATGAPIPDGFGLPVIRATDPRRTLSALARLFHPGQPQTVVAITGTSGKTSVAEFTRQILEVCGHAAASLGTLGIVSPKRAFFGSLTTPDPVSLHKTLEALASDGVTHLAMEASSHGLDQNRLDGVAIRAAAFTNLGRDHMDYHPTVEHYFDAKMRLFRELLPSGATAVINAEGAWAAEASSRVVNAGRRVFTTGRNGTDLILRDVRTAGFAQRLTLEYAGSVATVDLPLVGAYQVENALVAAGLALVLGEPAGKVLSALGQLAGVKGRLEIVGTHNGGLAIVDYAHKPEALAAALDACRPFASGRLICVFGCGGDRDTGKRPLMGAIASEKSDVVIVTDDNPRTENPSAIRAEILAAAPGAREIADRGEAIHAAVAMMQPGDVVIVAGKGHETGQIVGQTVIPFSDHDVLIEALGRK